MNFKNNIISIAITATVLILSGCASTTQNTVMQLPSKEFFYDGLDYAEVTIHRDVDAGQACILAISFDGKHLISLWENEKYGPFKIKPGKYSLEVKNSTLYCGTGGGFGPVDIEINAYTSQTITLLQDVAARKFYARNTRTAARTLQTTMKIQSYPPSAAVWQLNADGSSNFLGTTPITAKWDLFPNKPYRTELEIEWAQGQTRMRKTVEPITPGSNQAILINAPPESEAVFLHKISNLSDQKQDEAICNRRIDKKLEPSLSRCVAKAKQDRLIKSEEITISGKQCLDAGFKPPAAEFALCKKQKELVLKAKSTPEGQACLEKGHKPESASFNTCAKLERERIEIVQRLREQEEEDQKLIASDSSIRECVKIGFKLRTDTLAQCRLQMKQYEMQHQQYMVQQQNYERQMAEIKRQRDLAEAEVLFGIANQALGVAGGGRSYQAPTAVYPTTPMTPPLPFRITPPSGNPFTCFYQGVNLVCR